MALNGTDFINAPWNTTFSPYTELFANVVGNGYVFYLVPLVVVTLALYVKTREPVMAAMFMITSGGLFSMGTIMVGAFDMSTVFIIFCAIGFLTLFLSIFYKNRR